MGYRGGQSAWRSRCWPRSPCCRRCSRSSARSCAPSRRPARSRMLAQGRRGQRTFGARLGRAGDQGPGRRPCSWSSPRIGVMAIPAKDLALSLPDNGSAEAHSPQRVTYDLIAKEFGPGLQQPAARDREHHHQHRPEGHGQRPGQRHRRDPRRPRGHQADPQHDRRPRAGPGRAAVGPERPADHRPRPATSAPRSRRWEKQLKVTDLLVTGTDRRRHRRLGPAERRPACRSASSWSGWR